MAASASNPSSSARASTASGRGQEQYTAQQVMEMFGALNLPVTDDIRAIESEEKKQRDRRLRDTNSTSPDRRKEAQDWFKNLQLLKDQRQELLGIVQKFFDQLADTALAAALSAGTRALTPEVRDRLHQIARDQCRLDDPLTRRFVDAYLASRNLRVGAPLVTPKLVEAVTAAAEPGMIRLRWRLPADSCDEIILRRQEGQKKSQRHHQTGVELCRGNRTEYVDSSITAGQWYTYSIYSIFRGVESQDSQAVEAMAVGEITQAEARWTGQAIELRWGNPGGTRSVAIFRSESARPGIRQGSRGPEPANAATRLLHRGAGSSWRDTQIEEGRTYHYLLLAEFANNVYSKGVEVAATVPALPLPVASAQATYRDEVVDIWWTPARQAVPEEYVVVRREGGSPAADPHQGQIVTTTRQTRYQDKQIEPGRRYIYTVFTKQNDLYSRIGRATEVVFTLAEVRDLTTEVGDRTVSLRWKTPRNVARVVIRRSVQPPEDINDGALIPASASGYAQDTVPSNDRTYYYLLCCVYRLSDGREITSPGLRCSATPSGLPDTVTDFQVQAEGNRVVCTWSPVARGQVTVLRCRTRPPFASGHLLNAEELAQIGHRLRVSGPDRVEDPDPAPQEPYYAAFTVSGSRAVAGPVYSCIIVEDVANLRATLTGGGVKLTWHWPRNCQAVTIVRRYGQWPEGPDDPQAIRFPWTLGQYQSQQESFPDKLEPDSGEYYYIVYAKPAGAPELIYAPGTSPGCRCQVRPRRLSHFTYKVRVVKKWFRSPELEFTWEADIYPHPFSGFVILGNSRSVPQGLGDGVELVRWTPQYPQDYAGKPQHKRIRLKEIHLQRPTGRLYCKLFLLNPAEQERMIIKHPDVSRPIELS
jgi:hypothetical protein